MPDLSPNQLLLAGDNTAPRREHAIATFVIKYGFCKQV